jgi:hypothetical protein
MHNKYPIETLADFLAVPEASIDACLADFKEWLALARNTAPIAEELNAVLEAAGAGSVPLLHSFTWIDDGIVGLTGIEIHAMNPAA